MDSNNANDLTEKEVLLLTLLDKPRATLALLPGGKGGYETIAISWGETKRQEEKLDDEESLHAFKKLDDVGLVECKGGVTYVLTTDGRDAAKKIFEQSKELCMDLESSEQGDGFVMNIWTARWGHEDDYHIWKTPRGWKVKRMDLNQETDKKASALIAYLVSGEQISPPQGIQYYFESLWEASKDMTKIEIQGFLDQLAKWIGEAEKGKPDIHWLSKGRA